mgnify:CR=1 FL=1
MKGVKALKHKIDAHRQKTLDKLNIANLDLDIANLDISNLDPRNLKLDLDPLNLKKGKSAADAKAKKRAEMNLAQRELDAHHEKIRSEDEATKVQRIVMRLGVAGFTSRPTIICVACFTGGPENVSCAAKYVTTAEELVAFNSGHVNNWPMRVVNTVVRNYVDEFFEQPEAESMSSLVRGTRRSSPAKPPAVVGKDASQFIKEGVRRGGVAMGASSSS